MMAERAVGAEWAARASGGAKTPRTTAAAQHRAKILLAEIIAGILGV
jgi:hypothetical protein